MPQCEQYPNGCQGLVKRCEFHDDWLCHKHYYEYEHMKSIGKK